jgi:hypothetical protein
LTIALRHQCRFCRTKLSEPTDNLRRAFCCRGCHTSFYRSRCLVCEESIRRKSDQQRFGSGHKTCAAEYKRFPHVYGFQTPQTANHPADANEGGGNPYEMGTKTAHSGERRCPLGWCWQSEDWEHRLLDRGGNLIAHLWLVGNVWYLIHPRTIPPFQSRRDLDAAKRLAVSMGLANLSLDQKAADRIQWKNAKQVSYLPVANLSRSFAMQSNWKPAGLDVPDFLKRTSKGEIHAYSD